MSLPHVSPTAARAWFLAAWLELVERPCRHDPSDVREEPAGIVCAVCDGLYRRRA